MFSTRNLVVNGGFSRLPPDQASAWSVVSGGQSGASWRRISVDACDAIGFLHSAHAALLEPIETASSILLSQRVAISEVPARRFVLRLTARSAGQGDETRLTVSIGIAQADNGLEVCRNVLNLSPHWKRHRIEFDVPAAASHLSVEVEFARQNLSGQSAAITDVRLVGLLRPVEDIAVRFDPRGDMGLASSRLRAFMLEDYLNLLGCRTFLGRGRNFDLYVCQKVQPWLSAVLARLARKVIVFDLDDNEFLISRWHAALVSRFARLATSVSVGSEFLLSLLEGVNEHTFLLENPVDILDEDIVRGDRPWNGRLVWFGMPENRWMLDRLGLDRRIETITRGGGIEFDLRTIDTDLVAFDLALLPVVLNDETLAKNANRLVKCVGLGLPFLASDTVENRRALQVLQLPEDFLVASEREWSDRIDEVASNYPRYRRLIVEARPRAFAAYGVETIAAEWLQFCAGLMRRKAGGIGK